MLGVFLENRMLGDNNLSKMKKIKIVGLNLGKEIIVLFFNGADLF
jgi:hypothetical protein